MSSPTASISNAALSSHELAVFRWGVAKRETPWIAGAAAVVTFLLGMLNALVGANAGVINAAGSVSPLARRRLVSYLLQARGAEAVGPLPSTPGREATLEAMRRIPHIGRDRTLHH